MGIKYYRFATIAKDNQGNYLKTSNGEHCLELGSERVVKATNKLQGMLCYMKMVGEGRMSVTLLEEIEDQQRGEALLEYMAYAQFTTDFYADGYEKLILN